MTAVQCEFDFNAVPWIAPATLGRHVLNTRIADTFAKWQPVIERNRGRLPVGLFEDVARILEEYAQVAMREALSASALLAAKDGDPGPPDGNNPRTGIAYNE